MIFSVMAFTCGRGWVGTMFEAMCKEGQGLNAVDGRDTGEAVCTL